MGTLTAQRVVARSSEGLAVDVETDSFVVRVDMPVARGGSGSAPPPGSIMRASIAACLVVGYKQWGSKLGVPIDDVEIEMTTEIDMRGQAGQTEVPPGWQRIRWHVRVTSEASSSDVERVLERTERLSPMLDTLHPRCERIRTFEVLAPGQGG
jgi:uncharacterized OsmC-like protein